MSFSILPILHSDRVSPATRRVLEERLTAPADEPQFFSTEEFLLLQALAAAVLPQSSSRSPVPVASTIDQRLSRGEGAGWRYAVLPPEQEAYRTALRVIRHALSVMHARPVQVPPAQIVTLLSRVQRKELDTAEFALSLWFAGFKVAVISAWLAHPNTMELLQYEGFADEHDAPQPASSEAAH